MCTMDARLVLSSEYVQGVCPSHSLGYYIGWLRNGTECEQLTEEDLSIVLQVLKQ